MSLADSNASFWGETALDSSGYTVSGAGDVNADGYDDFIIGSWQDDDNGSNSGQTWLILGKPWGWRMDNELSTADASFLGEDNEDRSGFAISGVGDVNGDGYDDFIIGAYSNDDGGSDAGQTYLILGKGWDWAMDTDLSEADASFLGEDPYDVSGQAVSGAGDVNGDGYDDFLIGVQSNDDGGFNTGQTYLILGRASGWAMDTDLSDADASFRGENLGDLSGHAVSGAGDVNGDGYDDFLIGAFQNGDAGNEAGKTYLIRGKPSGWAMDTELSTADASFLGEDPGDQSGYAVSGAGDVNADGFDDILIGAHGNDGRDWSGQTYLVLGKASGWAMDTDLSDADASFLDEVAGDASGGAVSGAGDVNGDGFDDFIIGAWRNDHGGSWAGQTYLMIGRVSGWAMATDLSTADASFWGEDAYDCSGWAVSGAGDVNGDGYDDLLIGAYGDDDGASDAGQTYLIFPDLNTYPYSIDNLSLHRKGDLVNSTSHAYMNDTIDVKVTSKDLSDFRINIIRVIITSSYSNSPPFILRLRETSLNTGLFIGNFTLKERTHEGYRWIGTEVGDWIRVETFKPEGPNRTLFILSIPAFNDDLPSVMYAPEDEWFEIWYEDIIARGDISTWPYTKNCDWIGPDVRYHNYSGTPDNSNVGTHWLNLTLYNALRDGDWWNVTIIVNYTPPRILTLDVTEIDEDSAYLVDYDSDDDGQGTITWHLDTAASWLEINETTGVLSGMPTNPDVGSVDVSISVDDGNGGWDFRNFTIVVNNVGDIPIIVTEELSDAIEDMSYSFTFELSDPDVVDSFTWTLESDIEWLEMNANTGVLSGIPSNDDVGEHWVDVRVTDSYNLTATVHLKLLVLNVNDLPTITTEDRTSIDEDVEYLVDYIGMDPDVGDVLTWSLETLARWLNLDESTGVLSGTPTNDDVGSYFVNITVSDGEEGPPPTNSPWMSLVSTTRR